MDDEGWGVGVRQEMVGEREGILRLWLDGGTFQEHVKIWNWEDSDP